MKTFAWNTMVEFPDGCPYAAALKKQQEEGDGTGGATDATDSSATTSSLDGDDVLFSGNNKSIAAREEWEALELARQKCPAFRNVTESNAVMDESSTTKTSMCPFSHAKTPQEIKQTLLQVPPSHLKPNGIFVKSLQRLHKVSDSIHIPGGCPVKNSAAAAASIGPELDEKNVILTFDQALEEFSLASIMARMAQEWEQQTDSSSSMMVDPEDQESSNQKNHLDSGNTNNSESTLDSETPNESKNSKQRQQEHADRGTVGKSSSASRVSLSEALKTGTAVSHQQAETVHFVKNFIRGKIDHTLYAQLVANLYHVYKTLEEALDQHASTHFAACHFPKELYRTNALQEDVEFWWPSHSSSFVPPPITPATKDYMERIQTCARENPMLLLAHAYTRYLGDLSGGKILARVARRALHLKQSGGDGNNDDDGLAFYTFQHIPSAKRFKDMYRECLNSLQLVDPSSLSTTTNKDGPYNDDEHSQMISKIVLEANIAFGLNIRLFEELDVMGNVPNAVVRPLSSVMHWGDKLTFQDEQEDNDEKKNSESGKSTKCPFASLSSEAKSSSPHRSFSFVDKQETTTITTDSHHQHKISSGGGCPWPFVFFHDPMTGTKCWQTWVLLGVMFSWWWNNHMVE